DLIEKRQKLRQKKDKKELRNNYLYTHTREDLKKYKEEIEKPEPDEEKYIFEIYGDKSIKKQLDGFDFC
ncbi:MAG: hypothetical protein ACOC4G_10895, partial [Bacillota bacterium]